MPYHLFLELTAESLQAKCSGILQFMWSVEIKEALSDINQESKGKLPVDVLACHAQYRQAVLVDVMEEVVSELIGLV